MDEQQLAYTKYGSWEQGVFVPYDDMYVVGKKTKSKKYMDVIAPKHRSFAKPRVARQPGRVRRIKVNKEENE